MPSFGRFLGRRRSVPRADATAVITLSHPRGEFPSRLMDVSRTGARVRGPKLPEQDEEVVFQGEDVRVSGQVVWSEGNQRAIEFDTPISATEVRRLKDSS
jgi:PilZ domain